MTVTHPAQPPARHDASHRWRPTVAVIDLDAIADNLRVLTPPGVATMAMVKNNAYGHGDLPVARRLLSEGASWLGVALVEEGIRLRSAGIDSPILVTTECPHGSAGAALRARLTTTVFTDAGVDELAAAASLLRIRPEVHVLIDTGLHRGGVAPQAAASLALRAARAGLAPVGVWTHFATSEDIDDPFTSEQLRRLSDAVQAIRSSGLAPRVLHAAATGGIMAWPQSHLDLVRPGIGLYGIVPGAGLRRTFRLRPAMSLHSRVQSTFRIRAGEGVSYGLTYRPDRESTIATLPLGYGDGYPRHLSNRGHVLIRGRRYPIAGAISMDQVTVDCGDDPIAAGDEVVLMGEQAGQTVTADDIAEWADTIADEVVCRITERVPRVYGGAGESNGRP